MCASRAALRAAGTPFRDLGDPGEGRAHGAGAPQLTTNGACAIEQTVADAGPRVVDDASKALIRELLDNLVGLRRQLRK